MNARRLAADTATLLAVLTLAACLALPLIAWHVAGTEIDRVPDDSPRLAIQPPGSATSSALPSLPLLSSGGFAARNFSGPDAFANTPAVLAAIRRLSADVGLGADFDVALRSASPPPYQDPAATVTESILGRSLNPNKVRSNPDEVVDLSTLLVILAQQPESKIKYGWSGAWAATLLRSAFRMVRSCDVATNLVFIISAGLEPQPGTVAADVGRAQEACGSADPTPLWIHAKYLASVTPARFDGRSFHETPARLREAALEAFHYLQSAHPGLPHGYAGEADMLLSWADESEALLAQPFQVRAWRRQALGLYQRARAASSDPRLLVGHARALTALNKNDQALGVITQAVALVPTDLAARVVRTGIQSALGAHREAAAQIEDDVEVVLPWWLHERPEQRPDFLSGAYGTAEYPPIVVQDKMGDAALGATVDDRGFVPTSRYGGPYPHCRGQVRMTELILGAQPAEVARLLADGVTAATVAHGRRCGLSDKDATRDITAIAALAAEDTAAFEATVRRVRRLDPTFSGASLWDSYQDLFRWSGMLPEAGEVAARWTAAMPDEPMSWQRRGEIEFLRQRYRPAAEAFRRASELFEGRAAGWRFRDEDEYWVLPPQEAAWARLQLGAALQLDEDTEAARAEFARALALLPNSRPAYAHWSLFVTMHVHTQLGMDDVRQERWKRAAENFSTAVVAGKRAEEWLPEDGPMVDDAIPASMLRGAQENNLALALDQIGSTKEAIAYAEGAVRRDPASPIFLETRASLLYRAGERKAAAAAYAQVLDKDPTAFGAMNNLAVLLADAGQDGRATALLKRAIKANPDFAVAWHNLGVLRSESHSPMTWLRAQGAHGRAARLDPDFRGRDEGLRLDLEVYESGLDVSRPLTTDWEYSSSVTSYNQRLTWTMVFLIALRIALILGMGKVTGKISNHLLTTRPTARRWTDWWSRRPKAIWAVALTVVLMLGSLTWSAPLLNVLALAAGFSALVLAPLALRAGLARRYATEARHFGWPPAMAVGLIGTSVGAGFAPFPALETSPTDARSRVVRWVAPWTIFAVGLIATILVVSTGVPMARSLAAGALLILGSTLTPIPPLDGASIAGRLTNTAITAGLTIAGIAFALRWL